MTEAAVTHRELDSRLEAIEARIETRIQSVEGKIDRLVETTEHLARRIDVVHAEAKADVNGVREDLKANRRDRWAAVLVTVFGTGVLVAAVVIFAQALTTSWTQHTMTELKADMTHLERQWELAE
jgi:hypothetical protein